MNNCVLICFTLSATTYHNQRYASLLRSSIWVLLISKWLVTPFINRFFGLWVRIWLVHLSLLDFFILLFFFLFMIILVYFAEHGSHSHGYMVAIVGFVFGWSLLSWFSSIAAVNAVVVFVHRLQKCAIRLWDTWSVFDLVHNNGFGGDRIFNFFIFICSFC